jgi:hypothetical protein
MTIEDHNNVVELAPQSTQVSSKPRELLVPLLEVTGQPVVSLIHNIKQKVEGITNDCLQST